MAKERGIPDDFWDIGSLLPKKRPPVMMERKPDVETVELELPVIKKPDGGLSARFREVNVDIVKRDVRTETVKININAGRRGTDTAAVNVNVKIDANANVNTNSGSGSVGADALRLPERRRTERQTAEVVDEYFPEGGLVKRVRIMKWASKYSFYEQFRFDAKRYSGERGEECPEVDFFSYTPQYRQMSRAQLSYYFWWRRRALEGEWLPASFSYVLLFVYETINLGDELTPEEGLDRLTGVWLAYRDKYHVLDKYLSEWLADYCMIHRLPPPRERLSPIMHAIMENASFREFYMAGGEDGIPAETMIALSSDYDWHKSKFAADNGELYARHIPAAVAYVAKRCGDDTFSAKGMRSAVVSRDAYCGSLCAHNVKCRIDIEYLSFVRSRELRGLMTELVKYSENRLRAALGVRSRLRVGELPEKYRLIADEYFDREFPETKKRMSRAAEEAAYEASYEAAYDALSHGLDTGDALLIEKSSWASTELLVDEPEETEKAEKTEETEKKETDADTETHEGGIFARLDDVSGEYLSALLSLGGDAAHRLTLERGVYEDEIVSRINEAAVDEIGDIIIEPADGGYKIVEDYRDDITA